MEGTGYIEGRSLEFVEPMTNEKLSSFSEAALDCMAQIKGR